MNANKGKGLSSWKGCRVAYMYILSIYRRSRRIYFSSSVGRAKTRMNGKAVDAGRKPPFVARPGYP